MPKRLSYKDLGTLPLFDLIDHFEKLLEPYERPASELPDETRARVGKTIAEIPDIYAWANTCHSYYDWQTDRAKQTHGQNDIVYKEARQRRDAMERIVSVIKMKYQGASREITVAKAEEEEAGMSRGR